MIPDFPTPDTITRPDASARSRTARANPPSSRNPAVPTAEASTSSTRRPSATSAASSNGTDGLLSEVALEQLGPASPSLEEHLDHLPHGSVTARGPGDIGSDRLHLLDGVGHRDRQPDPAQHLQIGQIVAHERGVLPRDPAPREQRAERLELVRPAYLEHILHPELARALGGSLRMSPAHPGHRNSRGAHEHV